MFFGFFLISNAVKHDKKHGKIRRRSLTSRCLATVHRRVAGPLRDRKVETHSIVTVFIGERTPARRIASCARTNSSSTLWSLAKVYDQVIEHPCLSLLGRFLGADLSRRNAVGISIYGVLSGRGTLVSRGVTPLHKAPTRIAIILLDGWADVLDAAIVFGIRETL